MMHPDKEARLAQQYPWLGNLREVSGNVVETVFEKEEHYGGSWQKRGGPGAFMMAARKWDRIENICKDKYNYDVFEALAENGGDIRDDIDDLIGYLLLIRAKTA